jgi:hypothetical protein
MKVRYDSLGSGCGVRRPASLHRHCVFNFIPKCQPLEIYTSCAPNECRTTFGRFSYMEEEVSIISLVHIISLTPRQPPNSETLLLLRSGTQRRYTGSGLSLMGSTISAEGCGMAFVHAENEMPCSRRPSSPPIVAPALNLDPKEAECLRDWCEAYKCSEVVHYSINRAMLVTLDGKSSFAVTCMGRVSIVLDSFERFWWSV